MPTRGEDEPLYYDSWLASAAGRPLSLSLHWFVAAVHRGCAVRNYFDNLLPDRQRIGTDWQPLSNRVHRRLELLQAIGRDCVGAIQLLAEDDVPQNLERI